MNWLVLIFAINVVLFTVGITISWIDIQLFGSGLYLALVSIVTIVIVLAFCVVGTDEQNEPTVAKQMWSKSRQTLRRYTIRHPRNRMVLSSLAGDIETGPNGAPIKRQDGQRGLNAKDFPFTGNGIKAVTVPEAAPETNSTEAGEKSPNFDQLDTIPACFGLTFDESTVVHL